jgi:hypothetical protein
MVAKMENQFQIENPEIMIYTRLHVHTIIKHYMHPHGTGSTCYKQHAHAHATGNMHTHMLQATCAPTGHLLHRRQGKIHQATPWYKQPHGTGNMHPHGKATCTPMIQATSTHMVEAEATCTQHGRDDVHSSDNIVETSLAPPTLYLLFLGGRERVW